jgi:hypothetical protein
MANYVVTVSGVIDDILFAFSAAPGPDGAAVDLGSILDAVMLHDDHLRGSHVSFPLTGLLRSGGHPAGNVPAGCVLFSRLCQIAADDATV